VPGDEHLKGSTREQQLKLLPQQQASSNSPKKPETEIAESKGRKVVAANLRDTRP